MASKVKEMAQTVKDKVTGHGKHVRLPTPNVALPLYKTAVIDLFVIIFASDVQAEAEHREQAKEAHKEEAQAHKEGAGIYPARCMTVSSNIFLELESVYRK